MPPFGGGRAGHFPTKSVVTATTRKVGEAIADKLSGFKVRYAAKLKGLEVGMAAGTRQHSSVLKDRLNAFSKRCMRMQRLRTIGINTAKIARTGGLAAVVYGEFTSGLNPSLLHRQRRTMATAVAPSTGSGGQNVDYALMMADGSAAGVADPAFPAHEQPIGHWAMGVWNK